MISTHNEALSAAISNSLNRVKELDPEKISRFCDESLNSECTHMCRSCKDMYESFMVAIRKYNNVYYDTHETYVGPIMDYLIYKYLMENHRDELDEVDVKVMEEAYKDTTFDIFKTFSLRFLYDDIPFKYGTRTKEEEITDLNFAIRVARNELRWNKISMFLYLLNKYADKIENTEDQTNLINYAAKATFIVDRILQLDKCVPDHVESNHYHMGVLLNDEIAEDVIIYYYEKIENINNEIICRLFEDNVLRPAVENSNFGILANKVKMDESRNISDIVNEPILLRADFSIMTEEGFITDDDVHNFIYEVYHSFYNAYTFPLGNKYNALREMVDKCIDRYHYIYFKWVLPKIIDQIENTDDRDYLKSSMEHTYLGHFINLMHNQYMMNHHTYKLIIKTFAQQVCLGLQNIDN